MEFCAQVDEFWAWCPTPAVLSEVFALGEEAAGAHDRYWDCDFQLLRKAVNPWPDAWPQELHDLNRVVRERGIEVPPNEHAHHPRSDALWDLHVLGAAQPYVTRRGSFDVPQSHLSPAEWGSPEAI